MNGESRRGYEKERPPRDYIQELYDFASAIDLINQRIPNADSAGSPRNLQDLEEFMLGVREAVVSRDIRAIPIRSDWQDAELLEAWSVMSIIESDDVILRERLENTNREYGEKVSRFYDRCTEVSGRFVRSPIPYVDALEKIDWRIVDDWDTPLDASQLDEVMRLGIAGKKKTGNGALVLAERNPRLFLEWMTREHLDEGTANGYRAMHVLSDVLDTSGTHDTYPTVAAAVSKGVPAGTISIQLGKKLVEAGEYAPEVFSMPSEQLQLLASHRFIAEEIYEIASKPQLYKAVFSVKPSESEIDFPSELEDLYYRGVNIQEYLDYLIKTGGCFSPGSTAVLASVIDSEFLKSGSPYNYDSADNVWRYWRNRKHNQTPQEVLDAWTIVYSD